MPETIRDVTVRVSLKQIDSDPLRIPELSVAIKETQKVNEQFSELSQVSQKTFGEMADDMKSVRSDADAMRKSVERAEKVITELGGEATQQLKRLGDATEDARNRMSRMGEDGKHAAVSILNSLKATGEGAFTTARGAAFLFSSTEEGFQEMLQNVARVQAGFDLFTGSFETVKGLTDGIAKLKLATGALTATEAIHTATTTAMTTAMTTARAAALAMWTALGPLGVAALAIAAAGTAIFAAWKWFRSDAPSDAKKVTNAVKSSKDEVERLASAVETLRAIQAKEGQTEIKLLQLARERASLTGDQLNVEAELAKLREKSAERLVEAERAAGDLVEGSPRGPTADLKFQTDLLAAQQEHRQDLVNFAELELNASRQITLEAKAQLETEQSKLESKEAAIKAEKDALKSAEARFGQLNRLDQERLKRIGRQGGPRTRAQADLVAQAGFTDAATEFHAARGRAGGFSEVAELFGQNTTDQLEQLQTEKREIEEKIDTATQTLVANERATLTLFDKLTSEMVDLQDVTAKLTQKQAESDQRRAAKQSAGSAGI